MSRPFRGLGAAGLLLASTAVAVVATAGPASADTQVCDKYGTTTVDRYVAMNNVWGADTPQCFTTTNSGFTITKADNKKATNGAPLSYTAIYLGCHYGNCSPGTNLPMQVSQISSATSSASFSYPTSGVYNAAYDIWLDPSSRKDGENKLELMIWFNRQGPISPAGTPAGTATVAGRSWEVWAGDGPNRRVVTYAARSPMTSWNFNVMDFINDVKTHSNLTDSWYLTSIQTGFEPWVGGTGLAVNSFTADVNGGGAAQRNRPEQPPAPAPTSAAATPVTPATPSAPVTPTRQPAPQPSPTRGDGHTYVVQPGDTLSGIAAREHVTGGWRRLYWLNRHVVGADPDLIVPGQRLTLR
ncbi:GH12 family glycosyl hydrolase domain-containing protein [Planosporangium mesophilum]|uniref:LysM domain-containing protein n=1 Tax=Planosporangium mesophilum TaxID=689768 RepID=A0A8J3TA24_9ACTN|nr:LysM peptidoglycan-binding domain-containing protein [Planosporangium mesophilum]GII23350.1 hypothetical protein Pme01_29470 [Planosporangium mesophilum]